VVGGGGVPPHFKWGGGGVSAKILEKGGPKSKKGVLFFRRAAAIFFENGTRGAAVPRCWEGILGVVFGLLFFSPLRRDQKRRCQHVNLSVLAVELCKRGRFNLQRGGSEIFERVSESHLGSCAVGIIP